MFILRTYLSFSKKNQLQKRNYKLETNIELPKANVKFIDKK